jgi:hypothetical protein
MDGRKSNLREPFAKGVEWFDLEEGIEGYSLFPILRLELPGARPPFVILAKAGIQRRANGKTGGKLRGNAQSTGTFRIWVPAFAGMTKSGIALRPESPRIHSRRSIRLCRCLPHPFARDSSIFQPPEGRQKREGSRKFSHGSDFECGNRSLHVRKQVRFCRIPAASDVFS